MRILYAALAVALIGTGTPAYAAVADDEPPQLRAIALSRQAISVDGLQTKLLNVNVRFTDETGVVENDDPQNWSPSLRIAGRVVRLTLVSGTARDGVWSGGVAVTTDWSGPHQPDLVSARDEEFNTLTVDPRTVIDVPTVTVTRSNRPVVQVTHTPNPAVVGRPVTQTIRVTTAAGQPWQAVPVTLAFDTPCAEEDTREPMGRTNAQGVFSITYGPEYTREHLMCGWINGDNVPEQPATRIQQAGVFPTYLYRVTATPASASAPAGSNVAVTGTLAPYDSGKQLLLQRRYPDGQWRNVNRGTTDIDSAFRILATPPGVGTYSYRVFAPAEERRVAAYSPAFTIRGT